MPGRCLARCPLLQQQRVGPDPLAEASKYPKPTVIENVAEVSTRFNGAQ